MKKVLKWIFLKYKRLKLNVLNLMYPNKINVKFNNLKLTLSLKKKSSPMFVNQRYIDEFSTFILSHMKLIY